MSKKTVRDNEHCEARLKRDHPTIYTYLKAGRYRTVTDTAIAFGLKKRRSRAAPANKSKLKFQELHAEV